MPNSYRDFCYLFGESLLDGDIFKDRVPIKIGSTSDPRARLTHLQTSHPYAGFHHVWFMDTAETTEKELKSYYASAHIRGEWFLLPPREVLFLMDLPASYFFGGSEEADWFWLLQTPWNEKWDDEHTNPREQNPHISYWRRVMNQPA